ncbi:hypothetical protein F5884DRAFT_329835 [Xylogone sp. PMI_703]|nr:hypothetical protein F5884DRAFT_329835 [Xylogone sp. PMI_703]
MVQNKAIIFKSIPDGTPIPGKDLAVEAREFDLEQAPPPGGIITKNFYTSFDPYQRGRMRAPNVKSYSPPFTLGQPIFNNTVAKVLKSDNPDFKPGDLVVGSLNTEEYSAVSKDATRVLKKINNKYNVPIEAFLGPLGMPGLTAYSSFYDIGQPKKGETIFISAASGAVGALVGQLAKREGLHVIGSVGNDTKLDYILKELKFDGGFNYKKESARDALKRLAPNGIDIYYDNVGGDQLDAALENMREFGRIVACGMISQYNKKPDEIYGVKNVMKIVSQRLTIRGFIVGDKNMGPRYAAERDENFGKWISEGQLAIKIDIIDGIDKGPEGFVGMLQGENFGKTVLKIASEDVNSRL